MEWNLKDYIMKVATGFLFPIKIDHEVVYFLFWTKK